MKFWLQLFKRIILSLIVLMASISLVLFIFEDRIISKVVASVNTYLKVPVKVQQIEVHFWRTFPRISVAFNGIQVADPLQKKDTLLSADQISLRFNPFDLLKNEYEIEQLAAFNGQLHLKYNRNGQLNCDIIKAHPEQKTNAFNLTLKDIFITQFDLSYHDARTSQLLHAKVEQSMLSGNFSAEKTTLFAAGAWQLQQIKKGKVVLLRNQPLAFNFSLLVDQKNNTIKLPQAKIDLARLPFLLDADVSPQVSSFDLRTADVSLQQLVKTLSPSNLKALHGIKAQGTVEFQLRYQTSASQPSPQINAYFGIQNGSLTEPQFGAKISALRCVGTYKNLPTDEFQIADFSFISRGAQFKGNLQLTDFSAPQLTFQTKGSLPLALALALYPQEAFTVSNGHAELELNVALSQNKGSQWQVQLLKGRAKVAASQLQLSALQKPFKTINCALRFDNSDLQVQKCSVLIGQSSLEMQALFADLFKAKAEKAPVKVQGNLTAAYLSLADFQSNSAHTNQTRLLPQQLVLHMPFSIQKFQDRQVSLESLTGTLDLGPQMLQFNKLQLKHAGGLWNGTLRIEEIQPERLDISTSGSVKNLDIRAWFVQWQNFGQDLLLAEQIKGKGALEFEAKAQYDLVSGLNENSLKARMHCRIEDGCLIHAPILQDLAGSLTFGKGRAILGAKNQAALCQKLQDVAFETLENTFLLENRTVRFAKMHIASSALDLDLVGKHSFEQQIDYAVGLRLRDLLVQETHTEFGEILDDGTGIRLFVRVSGHLDNPTINWDKKGRKEAAQQKLAQSNQESKEMLKAAFGLYKNDPSINVYQEPSEPHETIQLHFKTKPTSAPTPVNADPLTEKNKKLRQKLEQWKQAQEKAQEKEVSVRVVGSG